MHACVDNIYIYIYIYKYVHVYVYVLYVYVSVFFEYGSMRVCTYAQTPG